MLEPDSAAVIIVVPADGVISYEGNWLLVNDVVVDYSRSSVWIDNIADGDVVSDQQYVAISTIQLDDLAVKETIVSIDQQEFYRTDGLTQEFNFNTLSYDNGSKHILTVGVQTRDGLHFTDSVEITVDNRILGRIGALDLRNWKPHKLYPARLTVTNQTSIITKSNADDHWGALVSPVFEVDLGLRPFLSVDGLYAPGMYLIILRLADGTEIDLAKNAKTNPFKVDLNQAIKDAEVDITGIHQGQLIIGTYSATRNVSIWNFSENFKLFYQD